MMQHYTGFGNRSKATPQTEPIPGSKQVKNSAGGYSFAVDDMMHLQRFLVLGSSSNTYYTTARKLTRENLDAVERLLKAGRGREVVDKIVEISHQGRATSNDPALFALARCCACDAHGKITKQILPEKVYTLHYSRHPELAEKLLTEGVTCSLGKGKSAVRQGDIVTITVTRQARTVQVDHPDDIAVRQYAYAALPKVARTGTHWLHFQSYVEQFRGRGAASRRATKAWYQDKPVEKLAYQMVKYQQRDGWSQRDVLRLARPKAEDATRNVLYHWSVKGWDQDISVVPSEAELRLIWAFEQAKKATDDKEIATLIKDYRLPREAVPTEHLKSVRVWEALLEDMPMEAMTRNLATMTRNGVLTPMGSFTRSVASRLRNQDAIHKARLHPIKILAALMTYQSGKSVRGESTWTPLREIVDALNDAFYLAFKNVEPSNKRIVLALDVSGSMTMGTVGGVPGLTPRIASAAMALVTAATEPNYSIMAFSNSFVPLNISPKQRLDDAIRTIDNLPFGATDCSLPMIWAMENHVYADAFLVLTDSETWSGRTHPVQALKRYRVDMGVPQAKLIVVGMISNEFSIADPSDPNMLDVVGFDSNAPSLISDFVAGRI